MVEAADNHVILMENGAVVDERRRVLLYYMRTHRHSPKDSKQPAISEKYS